MRVLPEGTVSFLFTDIEGSTRLLQRVGGETYASLLLRHNELIRDVVGSSEVGTEGDSFFCVFETPATAVTSAIDIQRRLAAENWGGGIELQVRMGIHTGEGVLSGGDYVGLDVHRASRISGAAHGGQILISDTTRALVANHLPSGTSLRDLGEHRLKDLAHAEHLCQLNIDGLADDFPAPASLGTTTPRLPAYLTPFIGRDAELELLVGSLTVDRLVTLTGIGGTGKTRLAVEVGRSIDGFPDGILFVGLEDVTDSARVANAVADSLSLSEQVGRSVEATLLEHLAPKRALLILDNCEQVADETARLVERLLTTCPGVTALVTSREALRVPGERVVEVGALAMTDPESDEMEMALAADAVQLFAVRAQHANAGFDLDRWGAECVDICRRLEGIPLAIELAAARAGVLTPGEILTRLENRFDLLTARSRSGSGRHDTLEAAIDWSYSLLDEKSQALVRSLSVFRGGFTTEAVAAVHFQDEVDDFEVLESLIDLADKSLISRQLDSPGTRFRQLDTVREYALLRLREAGEHETVSGRHRLFFTEFARREARRLGAADQLEALDALETDHDNLHAVIQTSIADDDPDAAADMAGWLSWFWYLHAHFTEGERWAGELLGSMPTSPGRTWLRLLIGAGQYDFRTGSYDRARERLGLASKHAREQNIPRMEMWANAYLATTDLYEMHLESSIEGAARATDIATELGDAFGLGYSTYISIGAETALLDRDGLLDAEKAKELRQRFSPISEPVRALGERNMIGHILQHEGTLAARAGQTTEAASAFDASIEALTQLGQVGCSCHSLEAIAQFAAENGEHRAAVRLIGATDHLRQRVGISVAPVEKRFRSDAVALIDQALPPSERAAGMEEGSHLGLTEASHLARQTLARL